ncbi:glycosyltransferase family 2 protein [soil metagenome]
MLNGKNVVVVVPGFRVGRTLARTLEALPKGVADGCIYVDDGSDDDSVAIARAHGVDVVAHGKNLGYGAAQKTGYREALAMGADVVVMVHGDFQYKPELMPAMASMVAFGGYDLVLGSRMLVRSALRGGMPVWKLIANKALTGFENAITRAGLSEYHTGYRAFSRHALTSLPLAENRNDFVFDNETLAQAIHFGLPIGELSCPAHYFDEMSTIHFRAGVRYGLGVLRTTAGFWMEQRHLPHAQARIYRRDGATLTTWTEGRRVD